jgi:hypothetical protein
MIGIDTTFSTSKNRSLARIREGVPMKPGLSVRGVIFGVVFVTMLRLAFAQPLVVTIEAPAVQQSSFSTNPSAFRASNVVVEPFDELKAGFISTPVPFAGEQCLGKLRPSTCKRGRQCWRRWRKRQLHIGKQ